MGKQNGVSRKSGFTLIELLVVIAVIAILAAVMFPVFASAKSSTCRTVCANNMRQIALASICYADDNNGVLPGLDTYTSALDISKKAPSGELKKYLKTTSVLKCPVDQYIADKTSKFTYGINAYMTMLVGPGSSYNAAVAQTKGAPLSKSKNSSKTILVVEENTDATRADFRTDNVVFYTYDRTADRHGVSPPREFVTSKGKIFARGIANVCYLDGHAGAAPGMIDWSSDEAREIFLK